MLSRLSLSGLLVGCLLMAGCSGSDEEGASTQDQSEALGVDRSATVILLHGYHSDADGQRTAWHCAEFWKPQRDQLARAGHIGPVLTVGYYSGNVGCDRSAASTVYTKDHAGDVTLERGTKANVLTHDTPIEHAAYRVAWVLAAAHAENHGHSVRVIADSLGGPVVRWAIIQAALGNANYPSLEELGITRVFSYASPFLGTSLANLGKSYQAQQAVWGSDFSKALAAHHELGAARWYGVTSNMTSLPVPGDGIVSNESACLPEATCFRYNNPAYFHGKYPLDASFDRKKGAYQVGHAGSWGPSIDGPGAAALVAGLIDR